MREKNSRCFQTLAKNRRKAVSKVASDKLSMGTSAAILTRWTHSEQHYHDILLWLISLSSDNEAQHESRVRDCARFPAHRACRPTPPREHSNVAAFG
jgi:hypothetical protein